MSHTFASNCPKQEWVQWRVPVTKKHSCTYPPSLLRCVVFVAWNWPWWEYLYHRNWQMLKEQAFFFFRPNLPAHHCSDGHPFLSGLRAIVVMIACKASAVWPCLLHRSSLTGLPALPHTGQHPSGCVCLLFLEVLAQMSPPQWGFPDFFNMTFNPHMSCPISPTAF